MEFYVREIREKLGISQRELAKRSGVPRSFIEKIEANNANPSIKTMCKLAKALNVHYSRLASCDGNET